MTIPPALRLTPEQIAEFYDRGYLTLPAITTPQEIGKLRPVFERLFEQRAGREEGAHFDMVTHDGEGEPGRLPAIISPVYFAPELRTTEFRRNALAVARQLLGPEATGVFENAILKPARHGAATPWHQDEATRTDASFEYRQISIWMPLQDATFENGCMSYLPGSHKGEVLPHRSTNNDPKVQSIECAEGFDPAQAVPCPVPAGGAAIHLGRTLHCAGPNVTDGARYAYILAFELPPVPLATSRDFYWNRDNQAARLDRQRAWRKRGGIAIEILRRARHTAFKSPKRLLFEARRAWRALLANR